MDPGLTLSALQSQPGEGARWPLWGQAAVAQQCAEQEAEEGAGWQVLTNPE
jgi:hypothetical protein